MEKEALFWKKLKGKILQCRLCPHFCTLKENEFGKCKVRKNIKGKLYSLSYEKPVSIAIDPIEKKPIYHFLPRTYTFSIGMAGCNLSCKNCQNWQLSQKSAEELQAKKVKAEEIIILAFKSACPSISYTYSEPLVSFEYVIETAKLAKEKGLKNIIVSNGFVNPLPLKKLLPYIDAFNIDLKSIDEKFYKEICGARLAPILETLKIIWKAEKHLEITNLLIPGLNDKDKQIKKLVKWIKNNLSAEVPLHFSAFYPCYKLSNLKPTSPEKVIHAQEIARKMGMKNAHTGNI